MKKNLKHINDKNLEKYNEDELTNLIEELDKCRINCHNKNKFLEANEYKNKISVVKKVYEKVLSKDLKKEKEININNLDNDFGSKIEEFEKGWDEKLTNLKNDYENLENNLIEKHKNQLEEYFNKINDEIPNEKKDSKQLIEMKSSIEKLAKEQNYKDAHFLHKKYEKLRNEEFNVFEKERENKIKKLLEIQEKKQEKELSAFREKIYQDFKEMELEKKKEEDNLKNNYNKRKNKFEKEYKTQNNNFLKSVKISSNLKRC